MQITTRRRRGRDAEFREADAAYKESGRKEHAVWRHEAMRSKDMTEGDFTRAMDRMEGEAEDDRARRKALVRKYKIGEFAPSGEKAEE